MNAQEIISFARNLKEKYETNNPFLIAKYFGIEVLPRDNQIKGFLAQTIKIDGYPTIISINSAYTTTSQKVLCAHELGHALLHENCINHFATTENNVSLNVEREANLFAVALLFDDDIDARLSIPLADMNNYLLKEILDYNIRLVPV